MKGIVRTRKLTLGCPQGGVLSVLIWILAFDDLLDNFTGQVSCVGYADDGCLIIEGLNLPRMYKLMNEAIVKAETWAASCGLKISPEKTVYMLFTNKHAKTYSVPATPILCGGKVIYFIPNIWVSQLIAKSPGRSILIIKLIKLGKFYLW